MRVEAVKTVKAFRDPQGRATGVPLFRVPESTTLVYLFSPLLSVSTLSIVYSNGSVLVYFSQTLRLSRTSLLSSEKRPNDTCSGALFFPRFFLSFFLFWFLCYLASWLAVEGFIGSPAAGVLGWTMPYASVLYALSVIGFKTAKYLKVVVLWYWVLCIEYVHRYSLTLLLIVCQKRTMLIGLWQVKRGRKTGNILVIKE